MNVLIVDDSRMSRMMLTTIIKDVHPDWNVESAEDGPSAIALTTVSSFDIFTLDFNMPGMNGLELAEQLKPLFPKAKIALLTANVQDSIQAKAKALGIGFIAKPITADKITAFIG